MTTIGADESLRTALTLARAEAFLSGSENVLPAHLFFAFLKIIDGVFHDDARRAGVNPEGIAAAERIATEGLAVLGVSDSELTALRRRVRRAVRPVDGPQKHCSVDYSLSLRGVLETVARKTKAGGRQEAHALDVLRAMLLDPPRDVAQLLAAARSPQQPGLAQCQRPGLDFGLPVRNLTALARDGRLPPVIGRRKELKALARYLQRTSKRNVMLIGEAGVGKSAVVEGLAQLVSQDSAPDFLRALTIVQVDVGDLIAGTRHRGDMEERLRHLLDVSATDPNLVLFLDEIHLIMHAGTSDGALDVANMLKPALARSDFRCIGATTTDDFERHIKGDAALVRRFQILRIAEPAEEDALEMCRSWARRIEGVQQVAIEEDAIRAAVTLSARFVRNRSLPDKAIDVIENAAAAARISSLSFAATAFSKEPPHVGRREIELALEEHHGTGFLISKFDSHAITETLQAEIVGQDAAIAALGHIVDTLRYQPANDSRPVARLLFTGAEHVGKTFAAELLSRAMFGLPIGRFDLGAFTDRHDMSRLVGAAPGFIGHDRPGLLFQFTERNPRGLILISSWNKAHSVVQDYFLQIFNTGQATDSRGRNTDFRPYLFVITVDLDLRVSTEIGFRGNANASPGMPSILAMQAPAELLGVIDAVIPFRVLTHADYRELLKRRVDALTRDVYARRAAVLEVSEPAHEYLLRACLDGPGGPQSFLRALERLLVSNVNAHLEHANAGNKVRVSLADGGLVFSG